MYMVKTPSFLMEMSTLEVELPLNVIITYKNIQAKYLQQEQVVDNNTLRK